VVMYHAQRGVRQGRAGYLIWSILDGKAALRIPWRDLLAEGRRDTAKLEAIRVALCEFERKLGEYTGLPAQQLPPMPTPGAVVVELDSTDFYRELAQRVEVANRKDQAGRIIAGAREVARRFHNWRPAP
jgi:hypothetical protein